MRFLTVVVGSMLLVCRPAVSAMSLHDKSRMITSALCFQICCSMGRRYVSISSATLEVALNAPQIALVALACMLCKTLSVFFVYVLPLMLALDQIEHAYIIWGSAVALYSFRMSANVMPQVEPPRQLSALTVFVAFRLTSSRCSRHCSFVSIVSPRYLHVVLGFTSPQSVWTGLPVSIRVRDLMEAWVLAQRCASLRMRLSVLHVSSVVLPHARMPTSSMYPVDIAFVSWLHSSIRSAL
ncbi:hypothetical protein GQ44DRAFT_703987 [Phaeosphaeriaceae sp. PMI808]|nr:hypothetical protein GQ44DRAFT_703987 [Phaeosphaeriaceae sp. PMI808]